MITGTPALSRPHELMTQLYALLDERAVTFYPTPTSPGQQMYTYIPKILTNFSKVQWLSNTEYEYRYCDAKLDSAFAPNIKGSSHLSELNHILLSTVMIRRLKKDVLKDLPKKTRTYTYIEIGTKHMKEIKAKMKQMKSIKCLFHEIYLLFVAQVESDKTESFEKNALFMQLHRMTGEAKLEAAKDYLASRMQSNLKFCIFAHHERVLDGIQDLCKEQKSM